MYIYVYIYTYTFIHTYIHVSTAALRLEFFEALLQRQRLDRREHNLLRALGCGARAQRLRLRLRHNIDEDRHVAATTSVSICACVPAAVSVCTLLYCVSMFSLVVANLISAPSDMHLLDGEYFTTTCPFPSASVSIRQQRVLQHRTRSRFRQCRCSQLPRTQGLLRLH